MRKTFAVLGCAAAVAGLVLAECSPSTIAAGGITVKETPLYKPDAAAIPSTVVEAAGAKRFAYAMRRGAKQVPVVDGVAGKEYDKIRVAESEDTYTTADQFGRKMSVGLIGGTPSFSPGGKRFEFIASRAGKWLVVLDGIEGNAYADVRGFRWSRAGDRAVYVAAKGRAECVVVDGVEGKAYDSVHQLMFGPDGRLYYVARSGGNSFFVSEGKESAPYDDIGREIAFAPDGKHFAFAGRREGKCYAVVDGKDRGGFDDMRMDLPVALSADGKRYACLVYAEKTNHVVIDDIMSKACHSFTSVSFSPDGSRVGFVASLYLLNPDGTLRRDYDYRNTVVVDGVESAGYDWVKNFAWSPDSKHAAYGARVDKNKWAVVVDGTVGARYDEVSAPFFSADSAHVTYNASLGGTHMVVTDGREAKLGGCDGTRTPELTGISGGRHFVFVAESRAQNAIVVDGKLGKYYDSVDASSLAWSPGAEHFAYWVVAAGMKYLVVDGFETRGYMHEADKPVFSDEKTVRSCVKDGGRVILIEVTIH